MRDARSPRTDASASTVAAQRVLVTGFGPFPGVVDNPSGTLAAALDGQAWDGVEIVGRVIPVYWTAAWSIIQRVVDEVEPAAVIMFGVARDRARVEIERLGRNCAGARPDARGELPGSAQVEAGGPATVPCRLPWSDLVGPDVGYSDDAGDYLCNYVLYRALRALGPTVRYVGFVHVPGHPGPAAVDLVRRIAGYVQESRAIG